MTGKYKMLQRTPKSTKPGLTVVISLPTISEEKEANCMLHLFSLTVSTSHLADVTICFE